MKPGIGNRESGIGLLLALILVATPLQAQISRQLRFALSGNSTRLTSVTASGTAILSGVTIGGSGRIGSGRVSVEGAYRQGSLAADSGTALAQDLVEARLMLAVRPVSWLTVLAGPHARAFITPGITERWMFIETRVRAEGEVVSPTVSSHVELWLALGGSVNSGGGSPSARGGEAGVTLRLPRSPVWGRLAYAIDRATQPGTANVRTVEDVRLSIGIGR